MTVSLKEIQQTLEIYRAPDDMRNALDQIPSLRPHAQAISELHTHAVVLEAWGYKAAKRERERLAATMPALESRREATASRAVSACATFGVDLDGTDPEAMTEAWRQVLTTLEEHEREERLLDDTSSGTGRWDLDQEKTEARQLRNDIDTLTSVHHQIAGLQDRIDHIDPLDIDEWTARIEAEYVGRGLILMPGDGARPQMNPKLEARLKGYGIAPWAPQEDDADAG